MFANLPMLTRFMPLVTVLAFLVACGEPADTPTPLPPTTVEELLERTAAAMALVESYAFNSSFRSESVRDGQPSVGVITTEGERGPGDSYSTRDTYAADPSRGYEGGAIEWLAVDGVVLRRTPGPNEGPWVEDAFNLSGRPPTMPPLEIPADFDSTSWDDQATLDSRTVHRVTGTSMMIFARTIAEIDLYIAPDSYHIVRIVIRMDTSRREPDGGSGETITMDMRLSDFGSLVEIEFPADFEPAQFATYVFEINGDFQEEHLRDIVSDRLSTIGSTGSGTSIADGTLTIRLIGQTFPPERVAAALGQVGYVELLLRWCSSGDCTTGEGYVDTPTGVDGSHILRASPTRFPLKPTSPIGISLSDDGAALLNDLANELPPDSGDSLVLAVDGVLILGSPLDIAERTPQLRMIGDFTTAQQVEDWAAVIGSGPLDVELTLVDYRPPRNEHQARPEIPTPTPTREQ
jgi:hypothetical protein